MMCSGEQWMTHLPVCKPKRLCRYSTTTKLKHHIISPWFVGFLPSAKRRSWLPPARGETEDLNSMKYEIINIHRGSGTLCNYANYFRCWKKSESLLLCFRRCYNLTVDLGMIKKPGTWSFLALKERLKGTSEGTTRLPREVFFLTPVCGWLVPWSGMSCHYTFDGGCSCCLYKPLWLISSSRG